MPRSLIPIFEIFTWFKETSAVKKEFAWSHSILGTHIARKYTSISTFKNPFISYYLSEVALGAGTYADQLYLIALAYIQYYKEKQ